MGFEAPRTVYQMDFADTQYAGLEVAVRAPPVDELRSLMELIDGRDEAKGIRRLFAAFAEFLVSWNVERDGHPVPTTQDGLMGLEEPFVTAIILAWQRHLVQAPPPLPGTSASGGTSPEAALAAASKSNG